MGLLNLGLILVCLLLMCVFGFLVARGGCGVNSVDLFLGVGFFCRLFAGGFLVCCCLLFFVLGCGLLY